MITGVKVSAEAGKEEGVRLVCSYEAGLRCDVTGIAIPNYAMFLFFQYGASRFARREFSHASSERRVRDYRGISRLSRKRYLEAFAQRDASPINSIRCENGSDCYPNASSRRAPESVLDLELRN